MAPLVNQMEGRDQLLGGLLQVALGLHQCRVVGIEVADMAGRRQLLTIEEGVEGDSGAVVVRAVHPPTVDAAAVADKLGLTTAAPIAPSRERALESAATLVAAELDAAATRGNAGQPMFAPVRLAELAGQLQAALKCTTAGG